MSENKDSGTELILKKVVEICEDVKAVDIKQFDIRKTSSVADFYVICTGNSEPHLRAISDRLQKDMKDAEIQANAIDGGASSQWIVMDFHSVIVHIMHPDAREYYNLEALWHNNDKPEDTPWECMESEILTSERNYRRQT